VASWSFLVVFTKMMGSYCNPLMMGAGARLKYENDSTRGVDPRSHKQEFWKRAHSSEIAFQLVRVSFWVVGDGWQQASQAQGLIFLVRDGRSAETGPKCRV
jgi:hypothetical protein